MSEQPGDAAAPSAPADARWAKSRDAIRQQFDLAGVRHLSHDQMQQILRMLYATQRREPPRVADLFHGWWDTEGKKPVGDVLDRLFLGTGEPRARGVARDLEFAEKRASVTEAPAAWRKFALSPEAAAMQVIGTAGYLECAAEQTGTEGWAAAAAGIVRLLKTAGVRRGQVLSIDAHSDGHLPKMSAHYSANLPDRGPLRLSFEGQGGYVESWAKIYQQACEVARGKDVVSMTGSCEGGGTSAFYVFYYQAEPEEEVDDTKQGAVEFIETRAPVWDHAADDLISQLVEAGVQAGQVLSIDAHNNGPGKDAIFSAFFQRSRPGHGPLHLKYMDQDDSKPWPDFYRMAGEALAQVPQHLHVSLTGACNKTESRVMYLFYESVGDVGVVEFVWSFADTWGEAADEIIAKLAAAGVRRGQVLSIDAHNDREGGAAMFSAHYLKGLEDRGELEIAYSMQDSSGTWGSMYAKACKEAEGRDVISITGSCNTPEQAVFFVFYYPGDSPGCVRDVEWMEVRGSSWHKAACMIVQKLEAAKLQSGQVISIDAHNSRLGGEAIFSAHFSRSLPGYGPLRLAFEHQNTDKPWEDHCMVASAQLGRFRASPHQIISVTSSNNDGNWRVTFLFSEKAATPGGLADTSYVEARGVSWEATAHHLISMLIEQGVRKGQVLSIDAHSNGPDTGAILSAHYCRDLPDAGPLELAFELLEAGPAWEEVHGAACREASGKDVVSITGSQDTQDTSVLFIFYNKGKEYDLSDVQFVEAQHENLSGAAQRLISALYDKDVQAGQVVAIDSKIDSLTGRALCSAHYSKKLRAQGKLQLRFAEMESGEGWESFYRSAAAAIRRLTRKQFIACTAATYPNGHSVMTVWFQDLKAGGYASDQPLRRWSLDGLWQVRGLQGSFFLEVAGKSAKTSGAESESGAWSGIEVKAEGTSVSFSCEWAVGGETLAISGALRGPRSGSFLVTSAGTRDGSSWSMIKLLGSAAEERREAATVDVKKLRDAGPGKMPEDPCMWGLTVRQLQHLRAAMCEDGFFKNEQGVFDPNMYEVNKAYVKPWTEGLRMSLAVLYNRGLPDGRRATVFVSHSWAESFLSFVATLETGVGLQMPLALDDAAWICTFSVYQNLTRDEIAAAIASPMDSPFARVLRTVDEVVVVFNDRVSLYGRVWCVYEAFIALEERKFVRALGFPPNWKEAVGEVLLTPEERRLAAIRDFCASHRIDVRQATATMQSDLDAIMSAIKGEEEEVNSRTNCLQEWALKDILSAGISAEPSGEGQP